MFQIDRFGRQPIYEQIIEQVEQLVASGALRPNDQLPSVRTLSQTLSAIPNTLQKAYAELERRGITTGVPGSGRYISRDAPRLVSEGMQALLTDVSTLCEKLHIAGVPKQKVLDTVDSAYAVPLHSAEKSPGASQAHEMANDDAQQAASGKDVEL